MTTSLHSNEAFKFISQHEFGNVLFNTITNHKSFYASTSFNEGEIIANFYAGSVQTFPTYLTLQTSIDRHIIFEPVFLQYINHSCDPNVFFNTTTMQMVCIKKIQPGDELCFFYPSAEWDMAQPFVCTCKSPDCLQLINGASHLNAETLAKYRFTDFILQQLKDRV